MAQLHEIAQWTKGRLVGVDAMVRSVSTDTRTLVPGALFIALKGEHYDAHDFVSAARDAGAVAALVAHELPISMPQVIVADTLIALGDIARAARAQRQVPVIAITGSNGKTTVKTLTASILSRHGKTHVNVGNLNNEVGLPLTVLSLPADVDYAVFEMGAGKPGDIDYLAAIAQPHIGLVNNVAPAHLERLGSIQGVAETKGAIYTALPEDGIAVINVDDAFAIYFAELAGARHIVSFGIEHAADVSAHIHKDGCFTLQTPTGKIDIKLPLPGRHNVMNALAASAVAVALKVPLTTIRAGLEAAPTISGRLIRQSHRSGAIIIDDSYNANPGSFVAAIETLTNEPSETWLVMGDMGELGADAERLHADIGRLAKRSGIKHLYAVGRLSRAAAAAFGEGALHCTDQSALIAGLRSVLKSGITVLIKGSRASAMENVVHSLLEEASINEDEHHAA